jgi:uncharacterized repeat protein (TIGR03806 family)
MNLILNPRWMLLFSAAVFFSLILSNATLAWQEADEQAVGIEPAFSTLRFNRPVSLTNAGDGSNRIFVVEQAGVIRVFENSSDAKTSRVFLDISDRISRVGNEEGLLGLAFHPDYKTNGQFFVHYSSKINDMHGVIARFNVSESDPDVANGDSEVILLQQKQPYRNHNGGSIEFGPDGFLYISFGDGGKANDPHLHGQNLKTMLGSILRIDVDTKSDERNYGIPADNPFATKDFKDDGAKSEIKPEIWAFGLRNVWRFSFDRLTGELFAADVGQGEIEEVNIVTRGGNYGWNRFEANSVFRKETELSTEKTIPPVAQYSHKWGLSITGGNVYRGTKYPELKGIYFYADYVSGNLWGLKKQDDGQYKSRLVRRTGRSVSSFGEDEQGELFLCSFDGMIYRVVPAAEPENSFDDWPKRLSETDIFASLKKQEISADYQPYELNAPFWSDNANKSRYFSLPPGEKLGYRDDGTWELPVGARVVKHFQHGVSRRRGAKQPIETRLIIRTETGWEAATYVWNRNGDEAELMPQGKQFELWQPNSKPAKGEQKWVRTTWHSPSSSECASCHTDAAGYVLGMNTAQLNRTLDNGENQIQYWQKLGLIDIEGVDLTTAQQYCSPFDDTQPLASRARVLLEVNCAMCHRPNGPGNANIDLRYATEIGNTGTIDQLPAQTNLGITDGKIIAPGMPNKSLLLHRMETLGQGRMPTIGSNVVDEKAVKLLRQWIEKMKP